MSPRQQGLTILWSQLSVNLYPGAPGWHWTHLWCHRRMHFCYWAQLHVTRSKAVFHAVDTLAAILLLERPVVLNAKHSVVSISWLFNASHDPLCRSLTQIYPAATVLSLDWTPVTLNTTSMTWCNIALAFTYMMPPKCPRWELLPNDSSCFQAVVFLFYIIVTWISCVFW